MKESQPVSEFTSIGVQGVQELEHILQEILPKSHNFQPLILTYIVFKESAVELFKET